MSTFPVSGYLNNPTRTQAEEKTAFEDLVAATKQIPGSGIAETTLTLATDQVTPPGGGPGIFSIDTEAAAATDYLANIIQTNLPDGSMILVRCVSSARNVVVKNSAGGAGQISLVTAGDFTLGDPTHWLLLKRSGALWEEVLRGPALMPTGVLTKTANYTTTAQDRNKLIDGTSGTWTLTLLAAATAGKGFVQWIKNSGSGVITLDGNAAETIDGAATVALNPGDKVGIVCDGSNWKIFDFSRYTGIPIAAAGGTVDAITADFSPDLTLTDKMICAVVSSGANTSATPTFAPDGLTAHTITRNGGAALVAGSIGAAGFVALLEYNLANTRWELLNPVAATVSGTLTAGTTLTKNPVAFSSTTTQAHGLGVDPVYIKVVLECVTAELGYSIGDKIFRGPCMTGVGSVEGIVVLGDATNVVLLIGPGVGIVRRDTFAAAAITAANWKILCYPYKLN